MFYRSFGVYCGFSVLLVSPMALHYMIKTCFRTKVLVPISYSVIVHCTYQNRFTYINVCKKESSLVAYQAPLCLQDGPTGVQGSIWWLSKIL